MGKVMSKEIVYLKHPVSQEEKAKVIQSGKKILDIRFKPAKAPTKDGK